MKTEIVKICAAITGIIALAAAQDMSPAVFGVKPPLLLIFGCIAGVPAAVAAGLFTDALGELPFGCSTVFFPVAALLSRFLKPLALPVTVTAAALYQVWLLIWGGNVSLHTVCTAAACTVILFPVMRIAMHSIKQHIGIDIRGKESAE